MAATAADDSLGSAGGRLYAFQDLRAADSPFASVVQRSETERHRLADWFDDPDATNRFLAMGNRSLISLARRRGLFYDRDHKRFYFPPNEPGKERSASYRSVRGRQAMSEMAIGFQIGDRTSTVD